MTATLTAVSGLGGKYPACFLVEADGRRLMLDLGYGPTPGVLPCLDGIGRVDALLISHGHRDHVGGLSLLPRIGNPPLYATDIVAARLAEPERLRRLPLVGRREILGIPVTTGRDGHAPGGVWLHLAVGGHLLYMADYSTESLLYAADPPPAARTVIIDASAGSDDTPLAACITAIDAVLAQGDVLLPVPPDGRGPEIALHLARSGCPDIRLDAPMREAIEHFVAGGCGALRADAAADLARVLACARPIDGPHGIILAATADGTRGEAARLIRLWETAAEPMIVFTGYVPPGTPAERLVASGRARLLRWNVHTRLSENVALVRAVGADRVVAAFCNDAELPRLGAALAPARLVTATPVPL